MVLPDWVRQATDAEDDYLRKRRIYYQVLVGLLFAVGVIALAMKASGAFTDADIEGTFVVFVFLILFIFVNENAFVKVPQTPNYQKLAASIYSIGDDLGGDSKASKIDLKEQIRRASSLIADQQPEFEEKDLVFGVAVSVLKKLGELMRRLRSASESKTTADSLPETKQSLQNLATMIYRSKTVNDSNIESDADITLSRMQGFQVSPALPRLRRISAWFVRRSSRETFLMETLVALFAASLGTIAFGITTFDGVVLFLAILSVLAIAEGRLFPETRR